MLHFSSLFTGLSLTQRNLDLQYRKHTACEYRLNQATCFVSWKLIIFSSLV